MYSLLKGGIILLGSLYSFPTLIWYGLSWEIVPKAVWGKHEEDTPHCPHPFPACSFPANICIFFAQFLKVVISIQQICFTKQNQRWGTEIATRREKIEKAPCPDLDVPAYEDADDIKLLLLVSSFANSMEFT